MSSKNKKQKTYTFAEAAKVITDKGYHRGTTSFWNQFNERFHLKPGHKIDCYVEYDKQVAQD